MTPRPRYLWAGIISISACCLFVLLDGSAYYFDDFLRGLTGFYRLMYGTVNGHPHYVARTCKDPDAYGPGRNWVNGEIYSILRFLVHFSRSRMRLSVVLWLRLGGGCWKVHRSGMVTTINENLSGSLCYAVDFFLDRNKVSTLHFSKFCLLANLEAKRKC